MKLSIQFLDEVKIRLVDLHCEATSEKYAMGWFLDGRVSAVVGTHTHVPTADETHFRKWDSICYRFRLNRQLCGCDWDEERRCAANGLHNSLLNVQLTQKEMFGFVVL